MNKIQIRFDGPPEAEGGRFIEVEDDSGKSFSLGTWKQEDKHWLLVFDDPRRITELEKQLAASQAECERLREANQWIKGTPPKDGKLYLCNFKPGIMAVAKWREGREFEPQSNVTDYRCECCGRFSTPQYYKRVELPKEDE